MQSNDGQPFADRGEKSLAPLRTDLRLLTGTHQQQVSSGKARAVECREIFGDLNLSGAPGSLQTRFEFAREFLWHLVVIVRKAADQVHHS